MVLDVDPDLRLWSLHPQEHISLRLVSANKNFLPTTVCVVPGRLSTGPPDHISDIPQRPEERNMPAKLTEWGTDTNIVSFNTFPADRIVSFKWWVGKEGRDNWRKKERHEALRNSTAEEPNYSVSFPWPENPVDGKLKIPSQSIGTYYGPSGYEGFPSQDLS